MASAAVNLLLDRTCDTCRWRRRTDRVEKGKLVAVAEVCVRRGGVVPTERTCGEWAEL